MFYKMRFSLYYIYFLVGFHCILVKALFDPVSLMATAGLAWGAYKFDFLKDQTYCRIQECCDERSIPGNIYELKRRLDVNLFGQHIVKQQLVPAIEAHFTASKSRKPLVISFHGTPGTGKNFVADIIAETLYFYGSKSKYVHKYLGRSDFPLASEANVYKQRINREVREGIAACSRSLFIFDEVDKMPPGVFESLASLVDYTSVDKNDNSQAIFLFLSNTAGVHISDRLGELMRGGMARDDVKLMHFEQTLQIAAYNLVGGMQKTSLIEGHLIDHYLPFLPLEKKHVYRCIEAELYRWNSWAKPDEIEAIIDEVITYDKNYGMFATAGCKTIEKKVAVFVKTHSRTSNP